MTDENGNRGNRSTHREEGSIPDRELRDSELDVVSGAGWLSQLKQAQKKASDTAKKFSDTANSVIDNI